MSTSAQLDFAPRPWLRWCLHWSFELGARIGYGVSPRAKPERHGLELLKDIPYSQSRTKPSRYHCLDIYRPTTGEKRPALLYLHGGAFSMLSKNTHRMMGLAFGARLATVFNANYRLAPRHHYPRQLEDAVEALLWVADHGAAYGADTSRIVLAGESAGANLVTTLAFMATQPRPEPFARRLFERNLPIRAVVASYGVYDLAKATAHRPRRRPYRNWGEKLGRMVREELIWGARSYVAGDLEAAPLASPLALLEAPPVEGARPMPPVLIAVGGRDPLLDDSKRLAATLEKRGSRVELHVFPGEHHGFNAFFARPAARAKWRATFEFLRSNTHP